MEPLVKYPLRVFRSEVTAITCDEHMRACLQKGFRYLMVVRGRRSDRHQVHLAEQGPPIGLGAAARLPSDILARGFAGVGHRHQLDAIDGGVLLRMKAAEITDADNGGAEGSGIVHAGIICRASLRYPCSP